MVWEAGWYEPHNKQDRDHKPVSVLEGQIRDQAELFGVLNALYQRHLTLLSVEYLNGRITVC